MGVDLGLVRLPCTCTMSYYYATHRMVSSFFSLSKSVGIYAVLVNFRLQMLLLLQMTEKISG
jgi:hypothetical protein